MDMFSALLGPVSKDDELKALADTLRKRKRAADFYSLSTIKPLQQMGQSAGQEVVGAAERQGVLREALARRQAEEEQKRLDREWQAGQNDLNRATMLASSLSRGPLVQIGADGDRDFGAEKYWENRGKADSDALTDIYTKSDGAERLLNNVQSFAAVLDGVNTGALSEIKTDLGRLASSLGIEVSPDQSKLETARAISHQFVTMMRNPESGFGLTGNTSDKDVVFLKQAGPRIVNSPGGNALMIEIFSRINKRAIDKARMAAEFEQTNGRFKQREFEQQWRKYVDENPLFDDMQGLELPDVQQESVQDNIGAAPVWNDDLELELRGLEEKLKNGPHP